MWSESSVVGVECGGVECGRSRVLLESSVVGV